MSNKPKSGGIQKYIPIVGWLGSYKGEWLRLDVIADLSVWALLVPST